VKYLVDNFENDIKIKKKASLFVYWLFFFQSIGGIIFSIMNYSIFMIIWYLFFALGFLFIIFSVMKIKIIWKKSKHLRNFGFGIIIIELIIVAIMFREYFGFGEIMIFIVIFISLFVILSEYNKQQISSIKKT